MKNFQLLCILLCIGVAKTFSQPLVKTKEIYKEIIEFQEQADSLKKLFESQGFEILRESEINMHSQYEKPIILPLKQGTWYRVIFIGDKTSKLYEIRMYDWNEKQVVYENRKSKGQEGNIINYDYVPRFSEFHMIKPLQVNNYKKDLNGYMMLFKKKIK